MKFSSDVKLVNKTKNEYIDFFGFRAFKSNQIVSRFGCSELVTKYMLSNMGDLISFVDVDIKAWPFLDGSLDELPSYKNVSVDYLRLLQDDNVLTFNFAKDDEGIVYYDVRPAHV